MTLETLATSMRSRSKKVTAFTCVMMAFGLLLWARFIIVTGHPRTAMAEPVQQQPALGTPSVSKGATGDSNTLLGTAQGD